MNIKYTNKYISVNNYWLVATESLQEQLAKLHETKVDALLLQVEIKDLIHCWYHDGLVQHNVIENISIYVSLQV